MNTPDNILMRLAACAVALLSLTQVSVAQVEPATQPVLKPGGGRLFGELPDTARPPSNDPRDFNGVYAMDRTFMPSAAGNETPTQCAPEMHIGSSGYSDQVIQTPDRITFIAEANHVIRNVYLSGVFPKHIEPSYAGYSIGHWESDTLVVETRGIKSMSEARAAGIVTITRVVERIHKADGGRKLQTAAVIEGFDTAGKPVSATVNGSIAWRSDLHLIEFICEDAADKFFTK